MNASTTSPSRPATPRASSPGGPRSCTRWPPATPRPPPDPGSRPLRPPPWRPRPFGSPRPPWADPGAPSGSRWRRSPSGAAPTRPTSPGLHTSWTLCPGPGPCARGSRPCRRRRPARGWRCVWTTSRSSRSTTRSWSNPMRRLRPSTSSPPARSTSTPPLSTRAAACSRRCSWMWTARTRCSASTSRRSGSIPTDPPGPGSRPPPPGRPMAPASWASRRRPRPRFPAAWSTTR